MVQQQVQVHGSTIAVAYEVESNVVSALGGDAGSELRARLDAINGISTPEDAERASKNFQGLTKGLVAEIKDLTQSFALRYWIIDNSGSMSTADGHKVIIDSKGLPVSVQCSRFDELASTLTWHADVADAMGAWTQFRLVNAAIGCPETVTIGSASSKAGGVKRLQQISRSMPLGKTPLCAAVRGVVAEVSEVSAALKAAGKRALVVIASDGEATDGDVSEALKPLADLPVSVVVRLCTDDARFVKYWNAIDDDLELELDVLDDVTGEAEEVGKVNGWLCYSPFLQRLREFGSHVKIIDLLDERALSMFEIRQFVIYLLGDEVETALPHPDAEPAAFRSAVEELLSFEELQWDPLSCKKAPWVDVQRLATKGPVTKPRRKSAPQNR
eukprot:CAMPEP_0184104790 /NCGR_PEP_ID=MMETSP0974-20121125/14544_1 /TAXON_ID=483370 /ORGANISM="non described non described, Strain CCMP2097" /LENGTH=385 /DNA_ID=CAMNT_0026407789 /DNA_START=31 /DNA_END=1185 /DNA_ORIENTATION=-